MAANVSSSPIVGDLTAAGEPAGLGQTSDLDRVRLLTERMFSGPIAVEPDCDPEDPASKWWNVCVESPLDHAALRELRARWHDAVYQMGASDPTQFSLLIRRP
jgi:hypothetical protein